MRNGASVSYYTELWFRLSRDFECRLMDNPVSSDVTTATPADERPAGLVPGHRARLPRADAVRNQEKILRAAEEVFAVEGLAVPIDEVARRAGVGIGTVYRHFPTKEALFEAIVVARLEGLIERAHGLCTAADPGEALFAFVSDLITLAVEKRDIIDELVRAGVHTAELDAPIKEKLNAQVEVLLQRAQAAGAVRQDVNIVDLTTLLMGTCMAAGQQGHPECTGRLVGVICDGLRAVPRSS
jgi:AcrR family transcriptional regulator